MAYSIGSNSFSPPPAAADAPSWSLGWTQEEALTLEQTEALEKEQAAAEALCIQTVEEKQARIEELCVSAFSICIANHPELVTPIFLVAASCVNKSLFSKMPCLVSEYSLDSVKSMCKDLKVFNFHKPDCAVKLDFNRFKLITGYCALNRLVKNDAGLILLFMCRKNNDFLSWTAMSQKHDCKIKFKPEEAESRINKAVEKQNKNPKDYAVLVTANAIERKLFWYKDCDAAGIRQAIVAKVKQFPTIQEHLAVRYSVGFDLEDDEGFDLPSDCFLTYKGPSKGDYIQVTIREDSQPYDDSIEFQEHPYRLDATPLDPSFQIWGRRDVSKT
jgi:hypothetical protein